MAAKKYKNRSKGGGKKATETAAQDQPAEKTAPDSVGQTLGRSGISGQSSVVADNRPEEESLQQKRQLNRDRHQSRQAQEQSVQGMKPLATVGATADPKLASQDREQSNARDEQGPDQEEEQRRGQQFQQGTKQLREKALQEVKKKVKEKLKAEAKKKVKQAIKKKIIQRVIIWAAAAISPEVGVALLIIVALIFIIIYVCDIPGISILLAVVDFFTGEDFAGMCSEMGG